MKHTKGECKAIKVVGNNWNIEVKTDETEIIANVSGEDNAKLIAEAFNVTNETGYTPRQLAEQKAELLEVLSKLLDSIDPHSYPAKNWMESDFSDGRVGSIGIPGQQEIIAAVNLIKNSTK